MSNRYGRNQKRKHREEIEQLRGMLRVYKDLHERTVLSMKNSHAMALKTAQEDALDAYLKSHPQLPDLLKEMTEIIGEKVGAELRKHAQMIVDSGLRNARSSEMLALSARKLGSGEIAIRAEARALHYTIEGMISNLDWNVIPGKIG